MNGKIIEHPRREDDGDFTAGDQYQIRYSLEYPEMFRIVAKLPGNMFK